MYGAMIGSFVCTVEPPNNGHIGDECFFHCSEVFPSSEAGGEQRVVCREVVHSSEYPLSEVPLYIENESGLYVYIICTQMSGMGENGSGNGTDSDQSDS